MLLNSYTTMKLINKAVLNLKQYCMRSRGGGTGPADPAAAGPIIYSEITRTKNCHKNIF